MSSVLTPQQPIGIFDSGIGGLTIAKAIMKHLPNEHIIYFGDTAHLPYGDKSAHTIQGYSIKIAEWLVQQHCKLILIACNSASTAAFDLIKTTFGDQAIIMNVIDPLIAHLQQHYADKHLGLIGTRQTVNSNVYNKKLKENATTIQLTSLATNLLASAIEEFGNSAVIDNLLEQYLANATFEQIDGLILACTHYPVVKEKIAAFYQHKIPVIDPSDIVALAVKEVLSAQNLLNKTPTGSKHFYVSDYTASFANGTKLFFQEEVSLKHYPLWD